MIGSIPMNKKSKQRFKMEAQRLCLLGVGLSFLILISCTQQKTYFGIGSGNAGDPLFGYYRGGQFVPIRMEENFEKRMQDQISFNRSFPVGEVFAGVSFEGHPIKVQIKSKKDYKEGFYDHYFELQIPQTGENIFPISGFLFWTPNIKVKFLKSFDAKLDEAALKQIHNEALRLWKEALKEIPEYYERRTLPKIELLAPMIQKVEGVEEVVTVLIPTLIKKSLSFVEKGLKHEFEHVDDNASLLFIYSVSGRKIVFGSFGHPGWGPDAVKVVTVKPLVYFQILGDPSVYFLGEHSLAWEHWGYAIFNLKSGKGSYAFVLKGALGKAEPASKRL
jgi:hypothetical protein